MALAKIEDIFKSGDDNQVVKAINEFFGPKDLEVKTDLREKDVEHLTKIEVLDFIIKNVLGDKAKDTMLSVLVRTYKINRIPVKRKSRAEFIDAIKNRLLGEEQKKQNLARKMFGV